MQKKIKGPRIKYTKDFINRRNVRITKKFKFSIKKKNQIILIASGRINRRN